ncbi:MAG: hypothetical protein GYA46_14105 [candidate division Zixibacteria bacterium]|nr:hypothetical protein [candidate division Zixibacteria bacterium]
MLNFSIIVIVALLAVECSSQGLTLEAMTSAKHGVNVPTKTADMSDVIPVVMVIDSDKDDMDGALEASGDYPANKLIMSSGDFIMGDIVAVGGLGITSSSMAHCATVTSAVVGRAKSAHFNLNMGIQYAKGQVGRSCCLQPGDANDDGFLNVGDAVFIINFVFKGGAAPPCLTSGDANYDCAINIGDALYIVNYVQKGGKQPKCSPCK